MQSLTFEIPLRALFNELSKTKSTIYLFENNSLLRNVEGLSHAKVELRVSGARSQALCMINVEYVRAFNVRNTNRIHNGYTVMII